MNPVFDEESAMKRIREFFLRTILFFALAVGFSGAVEAGRSSGPG